MKLTRTRSTVRLWQPADAPSAARHIGNYNVSRYMSLIPHPYSLSDAETWIAKATTDTPMTHFAIDVAGEAVGGIGLTFLEPARNGVSRHVAEFGYWLGEDFWGRGIVSEVVPAFVDWAFAEHQLVRICAAVYAPNAASARILEKAGFAFEGRERARYFKDGQYFDGLMFAKIREPLAS